MGRPTWVVSGRKEGSFLAEDAKRELKVSTVELELEKKKKEKEKEKLIDCRGEVRGSESG